MSSLSGISKEQRELLKLIKKGKQNLNFVGELNRYKSQYASKVKMVNGKPVVWDERTNKPYDKDEARTFVNKKFYGTDTPFKDLAYLKQRDRLKLQKIDPIRKRFSRKTIDGSTVYEEEFAAKQAKNQEKLFDLSLGTSYDHALNPGSPGYKDGGEEVATMVNGVLQPTGDYSTGTGVVETPKGDNIDLTQTNYNPKEKEVVQKAVTPDVKSDVKPNRAALKSDIFTLDKDGKALGVMTRGQRRRWEAANQDTMAANIKKLKISDRTYANRVGSG